MTRCRAQGCRRAPEYPDQAYCQDHQPRWLPEWRRRAMEEQQRLGRVAIKEVA